MVIPSVDEILIKIASFSFKETLAYLVSIGLLGKLNDSVYLPIKQAIKNKWNQHCYAFVPNKKEVLKLKKLEINSQYIAFKKILPKNQYTDIIKTGLLIKTYLDNPTNSSKERTREIKINIRKRPNGKTYLGIIRLASTPQYFDAVLNELYRLQKEGYSEKQLSEEFDEIIKEWDKCHFPVKTNTNKYEILSFCKNQISLKTDRFFLIGMIHASEIILEALNELNQIFDNNGYISSIYVEGSNGSRTEVIIKRKLAFIELED